jgi:NTE family protein
MANHIMTYAIVSEKLKSSAPDLLLRPKVHTFGALDFARATPILRAAEPIKAEVMKLLGVLLAR